MYTLQVCCKESLLENNFLLDNLIQSRCRDPWPESVSEVSAECNSPHISSNINVMGKLSSPTREICNSLSLSTLKWWLTALQEQDKAASEWLCKAPLVIQSHAIFDPVKKAKVKAVHKVRNKDLILPLRSIITSSVKFLLCSNGTSRTVPANRERNRQFRWNGTLVEVVDLLWSYVPCGRLE